MIGVGVTLFPPLAPPQIGTPPAIDIRLFTVIARNLETQ